MVDIDSEKRWSITFDFDKFILISNLQTTDVSFMPRVAVWISLHAWLIHGFGFLFSYTSKETRQNPATAPINVKIIH